MLTSSAVDGSGLQEVWTGVTDFIAFTRRNGFFRANRNRQSKYWMYESINEALRNSFYRDPHIDAALDCFERKVLESRMSSFIAAKELLNLYFGDLKREA